MPNIPNALKALRQEEARIATSLDKVRSAIAALTDAAALPARRRRIKKAAKKAVSGTRKMTAVQRKAVSKRMKAYWAARRKAKQS